MLTIFAKVRQDLKKKVKTLRQKDILPAVLYGPKIKKALPLELNYKTFEKIYKEAGESSLVELELQGEKKKFLVLVHEIQRNPISDKISHVDFYQAPLEEEVVVKIPLVFEGEAPAVRESGGTFIKNISEVEVKALPYKLPKEIKVKIGVLKTFEDNILIKDLELPPGVKILKEPEEIVAAVLPPEKVEEELEKPIEEKVEEVEVIREKEKKEAEETEIPEEIKK